MKPLVWAVVLLPILFFGANTAQAQEAPDESEATDAANPVLAKQFRQGVTAYDAKKYARAFELWLPLAQNGDLAAQRNVAHLLRRGLGVKRDLVRARKFYEQSAEFGFVTAQTNLGVMLLEGEGGDAEPEEAAYWLDRAARGGHPIAQFHLARLYETGTGVTPNPGRALGWYALAARSGHQPSLDRLAELVMILPGPSTDETDPADQEEASAPPEVTLDTEKQAEETTAEPEQGDDISADAETDAQEKLAAAAAPTATDVASDGIEQANAAYASGKFKDAQLQFESLAYKGNAEAQYHLGRMRNRGEGEPRDPVAALAWWTVAAEAGNGRAARAAQDLGSELGPRRRGEAEREAAQFKALITQLSSGD